MIALALRRQRAALLAVAGVVVLGAIGIVALFATGFNTDGPFLLLVLFLPLLIGVITGATVFTRELDHGEHVFTLTQGRRRTTWWASALGVAAIATALAAGVLSLVNSPLVGGQTRSPLYLPWFESTGVVVIAYALFAFAIAATVGLLTRSTVAAVIIAMIVYLVVAFTFERLRVDYLPVEVVTVPAGVSDVFSLPAGARPVSTEYVLDTGRTIPAENIEWSQACKDVWQPTCYTDAGVVATLNHYQPASRYWPFQLIESAILLALSGLVLAVGRIGLKRATRP